MSRHGYNEGYEDDRLAHGRWRAQIASATRGKRGQAFFRAMAEALDAMPEKRLVSQELETRDGEVCALGCLGKARGADFSSVDTADHDKLGELFNITPGLAQEVMFINDEWGFGQSPEQRWETVRKWVARQIKADSAPVDG
jgi:hypothetical protein